MMRLTFSSTGILCRGRLDREKGVLSGNGIGSICCEV